MTAPPRRIAWIIPPPEICCLCKEPLTKPQEASSWNGSPAHRECVRVHLMHRDPAFRGSEGEDGGEETSDAFDGFVPHDDDEADFG